LRKERERMLNWKTKKAEEQVAQLREKNILMVQRIAETLKDNNPGKIFEKQGATSVPAENNDLKKIIIKKMGNDKGGSLCHIKSNNICGERMGKQICNKDKLLKKYRLQEGSEREWIGEIKTIMEKQQNKSLEQQLTELMPLVRYHQEIKNVMKAKRIAVRQKLDAKPINELLNRLSKLYGRDINQKVSRKINKRIKCHKCKKRGHLRKNCPEKQLTRL